MPDVRLPGYKGVRKYDPLSDQETSLIMTQEDAMLMVRNLIESKEWWIFFPSTSREGLFIGDEVEEKFYATEGDSAWDYKAALIMTPLGPCVLLAAHKSRMSVGDLSMILGHDVAKKDIIHLGQDTGPTPQAVWVLNQIHPNINSN